MPTEDELKSLIGQKYIDFCKLRQQYPGLVYGGASPSHHEGEPASTLIWNPDQPELGTIAIFTDSFEPRLDDLIVDIKLIPRETP